jgi:glucose/arabinose dehydrogenase
VQHGREQLNLFPQYFDAKRNAELPSEELIRLQEGADYGWPYCYHDWQLGKRVLAPEYGGDGTTVGDCAKSPAPMVAYPGHWAPGALLFYTGAQFPKKYQGGAFIAFQGSSNRSPEPQGGFNIVFQPFKGSKPSGAFEVFADGFAGKTTVMNQAEAQARPGGLAEAPDGSIYVSDLVRGRIWRVIYQGNSRSN